MTVHEYLGNEYVGRDGGCNALSEGMRAQPINAMHEKDPPLSDWRPIAVNVEE